MTPVASCAMPSAANSAANTQPSGVRPAAANMPPYIKSMPFKTLPKIYIAAYSPAHSQFCYLCREICI